MSSNNRSTPAAPAAVANHATLSPGASRLTTADINVRAQPSLTGNLMATLGENTVIDIEEPSPDGQWTRINAVPIVADWPEDLIHLLQLLCVGDGRAYRLNLDLRLVKTTEELASDLPHNALSDARALMRWYQLGVETSQMRKPSKPFGRRRNAQR